ncbi:MAG: hypothetical protein LBC62_10750, partial [Treponema sp.]|nr:hypothetical protein [Treponema sp.]
GGDPGAGGKRQTLPDEAPLDGEELLHYRFTRRMTEQVGVAAEEAGMTAYFCSRYENRKGEAGKWGPVVSAIIP